MLMVIWAHCGAIFTPVITFFHMPLFFFISGYLFKKRDFKSFFLRRVKSLYIPFLGYEIVFLTLRNLFLNIGLYTSADWSWMVAVRNIRDLVPLLVHILLFDNVDELLSTLWFPTCLFFVELIFWCENRLIHYRWLTIGINSFLMVIGYLLYVRANVIIGWSYNFKDAITVILISLFFYDFGVLSKETKIFSFSGSPKVLEKILALIFAVVLLVAWRLGQYTDYRACSFSNPINCLILSILGIYSTIQIGRSLYILCSKNALGRSISSLIKNTGLWSYHFMALQFLAMKPVSALIAVAMRVPVDKYLGDFGLISIASAWWRIIGFVLTTVICYICAYTIRHLHTIFGNGKI